MKWYYYVAAFFAGVFLANAVPHFVSGVCGDPFPTPFADPPGKGLSPPTVNVAWALGNLVVGYVLLRVGRVSPVRKWSLLAFFVGAAAISLQLAAHFAGKAPR